MSSFSIHLLKYYIRIDLNFMTAVKLEFHFFHLIDFLIHELGFLVVGYNSLNFLFDFSVIIFPLQKQPFIIVNESWIIIILFNFPFH